MKKIIKQLFIVLGFLAIGKLTAQTSVQWTNIISGTLSDAATRTAVDRDGNVIVIGTFGDSLTLGGNLLRTRGLNDIFIAKYRPNGQLIWAKTAGGSQNDNARNLTTDAQGNIYVVGDIATANPTIGATNSDTAFFDNIKILSASSTRYSQAGLNCYLTKITPSGTFEYVRTGVSQYDCRAATVAVDADGTVYVGGTFRDTLQIGNKTVVQPWLLNGAGSQFSIRGPDNFLAKYTPSGSVEWLRQTRTTWANNGIDPSVKIGADGKIYWLTEFLDSIRLDTFNLVNPTSGFGDEIGLMRLSKTGALERIVKISSMGDDWLAALDADAMGNVTVAGSFTGTLTVGTQSATSAGSRDAFLTRLNNNFEPIYLKTIGGTATERFRDMARLSNGDVVVVGDFGSPSVIFGTDTLVSSGSGDWLVAQFRADGTPVTAKRFGTANFETAAGVSVNRGDTLYIGGYFRGSSVLGSDKTSLFNSVLTSANATQDALLASVYVCPKTPLPASVVGNLSFCDGDSVRLTLPSGYSKYWWSTGDSLQTITVKSQNNYFGTYTNRNACVISTITAPIFVEVKPAPPVPTIARSNDTLRVTPPSNYTFQWLLNGAPLSNSNQNFWKMTANGNYTARIVATNGCDRTSLAFTFTRVSTADLAENLSASVAPNPAQLGSPMTVFIDSKKSQNVDFQLISALGQLVFQKKETLAMGKNTLDLGLKNATSGVHFLKIQTADGRSAVLKIVFE